MLFKCPVCKDFHRVNNQYDQQDYICPATHGAGGKRKIFQNMIPTDLLSRSGFNWNVFSTRIDENRAATIIPKPFKSDASRVNRTKRRNMYNY